MRSFYRCFSIVQQLVRPFILYKASTEVSLTVLIVLHSMLIITVVWFCLFNQVKATVHSKIDGLACSIHILIRNDCSLCKQKLLSHKRMPNILFVLHFFHSMPFDRIISAKNHNFNTIVLYCLENFSLKFNKKTWCALV